MKPILKIEVPRNVTEEEFKASCKNIDNSDALREDYHVIVIKGTGEFTHMEIITASDINLHLKDS